MLTPAPGRRARLVRAGLMTGVLDGLFSSVLVTVFYGSTFSRLWQGVASTLLGPRAMGGTAETAIGLAMHFGVAFGWSAVFLVLYERSGRLRAAARSPAGIAALAAIYGPLIWIAMSLAVIPLLVHRPPSITPRWWVQLAGHIPFVALPIIVGVRTRTPAA
jgi:hypothetical protein